ncbi:hypothetical protein Taro_020332, partial [Colocasia esculenta]|nr:hypothetical protein [Colocasia esculenta]
RRAPPPLSASSVAPPSTGTCCAELLHFPSLRCSSLDREPSSSASQACTAPSSTGNEAALHPRPQLLAPQHESVELCLPRPPLLLPQQGAELFHSPASISPFSALMRQALPPPASSAPPSTRSRAPPPLASSAPLSTRSRDPHPRPHLLRAELPALKERELQNLLRWLPGYEASQINMKGEQPMGFALFSTPQHAMAAKDALQNMVFDAESKAVLHTEMAKKNLFVKRGKRIFKVESLEKTAQDDFQKLAFVVYLQIATLIAVYANGGFATIKGIGWDWAVVPSN